MYSIYIYVTRPYEILYFLFLNSLKRLVCMQSVLFINNILYPIHLCSSNIEYTVCCSWSWVQLYLMTCIYISTSKFATCFGSRGPSFLRARPPLGELDLHPRRTFSTRVPYNDDYAGVTCEYGGVAQFFVFSRLLVKEPNVYLC